MTLVIFGQGAASSSPALKEEFCVFGETFSQRERMVGHEFNFSPTKTTQNHFRGISFSWERGVQKVRRLFFIHVFP